LHPATHRVSLAKTEVNVSQRAQSNRGTHKPQPPALNDILDEIEVDETLDESFPASDAPSWTTGVDEARRDPERPDSDE